MGKIFFQGKDADGELTWEFAECMHGAVVVHDDYGGIQAQVEAAKTQEEKDAAKKAYEQHIAKMTTQTLIEMIMNSEHRLAKNKA